jgi:hypothetical protein
MNFSGSRLKHAGILPRLLPSELLLKMPEFCGRFASRALLFVCHFPEGLNQWWGVVKWSGTHLL